jgi:YfiH family protein
MNQKSDPGWCYVDWDVPDNVVALTTARPGGNSIGDFESFNLALHVGDDPGRVQQNRRQLRQFLGDQVDFQWLQQTHGTDVVQAARGGYVQNADAAYTTETDLACCVLTADCLPVFLADSKGSAVALAHAGWRGLAAGILERTVASLPAPGGELRAWLGPAIGPCHFQVGKEVKEAFLAAAEGELLQGLETCFAGDREPGKYRADLYRLATLKLEKLGVEVSGGGLCTYCDDTRFYSFRRQKNTGRMASLIYLKS